MDRSSNWSPNLRSETVTYLIVPPLCELKTIFAPTYPDTTDFNRLNEEISLIENVLKDENSESLAICLAVQNAKSLINHLICRLSKTIECRDLGMALRRLKKMTKKAVATRNRKFFSGDRAAIKTFDQFIGKILAEQKLQGNLYQRFFERMLFPKNKVSVKTEIVSHEIFDLRAIKSIVNLEDELKDFVPTVESLLARLSEVLIDLDYRFCVHLAFQLTSKTKDGVLKRETKFVKLLLDDSGLQKKIHDPQAPEGMVEFRGHAT